MSNMRSPEEKEMIIKAYLSGTGIKEIERKYGVDNVLVYRWLKKYNEFGIEGLKSNTGKKIGGNKGIGSKKALRRIRAIIWKR